MTVCIDKMATSMAETYVKWKKVSLFSKDKATLVAAYNLKAAAFNIATIGAITVVALAVITILSFHMTLLLGVLLLVGRHLVSKSLEENGPPGSTGWNPNGWDLAGFVIWKNFQR